MKLKLYFFILITFLMNPTYSNSYLIEPKLEKSTKEDLEFGWSKIKEQWEIPNSEFIGYRVKIYTPSGVIAKEISYLDHTPLFIYHIIIEDKILIAIFESESRSKMRSWKFEIINSNNRLIFSDAYIYNTNYQTFSDYYPVLTKKVTNSPYFIASDDMFYYYLDSEFSRIKSKKIALDELSNKSVMPAPRKIKLNHGDIEITFAIHNPFGIEQFEDVLFTDKLDY